MKFREIIPICMSFRYITYYMDEMSNEVSKQTKIHTNTNQLKIKHNENIQKKYTH